ncbi:hypothetical protein [Tropicimonas sediminicola]|uniref:Uncharacterized protein n=1 Tax=Tropicimonas sediminicola TaxID=1031541 RepID=A0A239H558_9RHOB|nr:hypothetical protein [Tropicimonas sediminicola]SNS76352.1 hypothetical protein SAMN05421757_103249 [Tropicimonas sediminicola]
MSGGNAMAVTLALAALAGIMAFALKRALSGPRTGFDPLEAEESARRAYLEQARRDGVDPDVADAYEIELRLRRREMERQRKEEIRSDLSGV